MSGSPRGRLPWQAHQRSDDDPVPRPLGPTFDAVFAARLERRELLAAAIAGGVLGALAPVLAASRSAADRAPHRAPPFPEIRRGVDEHHHVAEGHRAEVLIRWGDPVTGDAPPFAPRAQSAPDQVRQFGYNNDFLGFVPLPFGSGNSRHGLLCVNHEYTNAELMFPRQGEGPSAAQRVDVEMAARGGSVVEVRRHRTHGGWAVRRGGYNRRITASTPMRIAGPAAGHRRLRTGRDPGGTRVLGTLDNCNGGITPWGTWLMAEENFHGYFRGRLSRPHPERASYERYSLPGGSYGWGRYHRRFDVGYEAHEPNRFGWIVEVDPLEPASTPVKRTALGRFKHEGAAAVLNRDGRVAVYSGDDQQFEYLYRFVTEGRYDPRVRAANRDLLDAGSLCAARFHPDGTLEWLPLVHGVGPLTAGNGFHGQADVVIEARRAADLMGATPLDRPEDVQPNPRTGRVYVMLTRNSRRKAHQVEPVCPRIRNVAGHVLELVPPGGDHGAAAFRWEVLVLCGDPGDAEAKARWHPEISSDGWFANPDGAAADARGNLWVATDQGRRWAASATADGLWWLGTEGPVRGLGRMFFRAPVGAEVCGPCFTPDDATLFVAVQHPGADGVESYPPFSRRSTFEDPATRWPDFDPALPVRPSVLAITRSDGGPIGG